MYTEKYGFNTICGQQNYLWYLGFNVANLSFYMSFNSMFYFYFQITNFLMDFYLLIGLTFL